MAQANTNRGAVVPAWQAGVKDLATANKDAIKAVSASGMSLSKLYRQVLNVVAMTPALQKCSPDTIIRSLAQAAELGLTPSSSLGECYLIPYGTECRFIIGYRGFISLARRSGEIESISAFIVYEGDEFQHENGLTPVVRHSPKYLTSKPEDVRFAVAIARFKDKTYQYEVMAKREIDAIRARSKAGGSGPWVTDYAEMAKKTVVRRLAKYLPLTIESVKAVEQDDANEFGESGAVVIDVQLEHTPFDGNLLSADPETGEVIGNG